MAAANQALYRRFAREVVTPTVTPLGFIRAGQKNMWRRDVDGVSQLIGFAAGWLGGARELEWDICVHGLDDLMRGDGPALPLGGRIELGYCHVSGRAYDLVKPGVLADHPELTSSFELKTDQTDDERHRTEEHVKATLQLFSTHLDSLRSSEDLVKLLTVDDAVGDRRFMPNRGLTPIYAVGIALLSNSPSLNRIAARLEESRKDWATSAPGLPFGGKVWGPVADRLLRAAEARSA